MNLSVRASISVLRLIRPSQRQHRALTRLMPRTHGDRADARAERILETAGRPCSAAAGAPLFVAARLLHDPRDPHPEPLDDLADDGPPRSHERDPTRAYWVARAALDHRDESRRS
jgi:hypothetical protein